MFRYLLSVGSFAAIVCLGPGAATAKDVFITIGGGPEPSSNQVSLEKNVQFFSRVLNDQYPQPLEHHVFFADGGAPEVDLQYIDDSIDPSPAIRWMTRIQQQQHSLQLQYRNHEPLGDEQPATKDQLEQRMRALASELSGGDRLVVYVTAHGGDATSSDELDYYDSPSWSELTKTPGKANSRDTSIALWGGDEVRVSEFTDWLDAFSPEVAMVVVMTQCYSGGFAEILFREGDRNCGLSTRPRCGFFSQLHNRAAAGCTPDIDEANYEEYSSYFWAAISGQTRDRQIIIDADYDDDGRTSFAEAHAYAVLASDTIDVPIRTSDIFLRRYSKIEKSAGTDLDEEVASGVVSTLWTKLVGGTDETSQPAAKLYTSDESIDNIRALATPDQVAIIDGLVERLEIDPTTSIVVVQKEIRRLKSQVQTKYSKLAELSITESTLVDEIQHSLNRVDPRFELEGYTPLWSEWTTSRGDEFVELVESLEESQALLHLEQQIEAISQEADELELDQVKRERLVRTLQNVLLEANLAHVADETTVEQFRKLIALERGTLLP